MTNSLTAFAHLIVFQTIITQPGQPHAGRPDRPPNWGLRSQLFTIMVGWLFNIAQILKVYFEARYICKVANNE